MVSWTDERVQILKDGHAEGLSYSQIACDVGDGATRNACIGKALRIGLGKRSENISKATKRGIARKQNGGAPDTRRVTRLVLKGRGYRQARLIESPEIAPLSAEAPQDIPFAQRKQLLDLGNDDCRWPYGEPGKPDFFFCGAMKSGHHPSYCTMHARASVSPTPRRAA